MYIKSRINIALQDPDEGPELTKMYQNYKLEREEEKMVKKRERCDGIDHINDWNACENDEQKYRFLKQQEKYKDIFNGSKKVKPEIRLARMCGTDARTISRIFATTTFTTSVVFRLENYHGIKDINLLRMVVEKIQGKVSIKCYCGKSFMNHQLWHIHHCHECGQLIGMCHAGCNTDEPYTKKIMNWMWGPRLVSKIHLIHKNHYDPPTISPEDCKKCSVRIQLDSSEF